MVRAPGDQHLAAVVEDGRRRHVDARFQGIRTRHGTLPWVLGLLNAKTQRTPRTAKISFRMAGENDRRQGAEDNDYAPHSCLSHPFASFALLASLRLKTR